MKSIPRTGKRLRLKSTLIKVGQDHRLDDQEPLEALVRAVERRQEPS